jgi:hypothetical protein
VAGDGEDGVDNSGTDGRDAGLCGAAGTFVGDDVHFDDRQGRRWRGELRSRGSWFTWPSETVISLLRVWARGGALGEAMLRILRGVGLRGMAGRLFLAVFSWGLT